MEKERLFDNAFNETCGQILHKGIQFKADIIAQKISNILPYSKIALFSFENDFFESGAYLYRAFISKGLKPINVIISEKVSALESVCHYANLPEDVRGIVAFNNRIFPLIFAKLINCQYAFAVDSGFSDQIYQSEYFFELKNQLMRIRKRENAVVIKEDYALFDLYPLEKKLKSVAVKTIALIDYAFTYGAESEEHKKAYSKLVDIITCEINSDIRKLTEQSLFAFYELIKKAPNIYYSCAPAISSFMKNGEFFNLDDEFYFAKKIAVLYKKFYLQNNIDIETGDYLRIEQLTSLTKFSRAEIVKNLIIQRKFLQNHKRACSREQLKNLLKIFDKLCILIDRFSQTKENNLDKENDSIKELSLLSGHTPFGINAMSYFKEKSLLKV